MLFRVVLVVFVPLFKYLLPINSFAVGNGFGLLHGFIVQFLFGMAQFHCLYCSIVEHVYASTVQALVKVGRAKSLSLNVEIGYVEFENSAQGMAYHLLLCTVAAHLAAKQLADYIVYDRAHAQGVYP